MFRVLRRDVAAHYPHSERCAKEYGPIKKYYEHTLRQNYTRKEVLSLKLILASDANAANAFVPMLFFLCLTRY